MDEDFIEEAKKENNLILFEHNASRVYILGTMHASHFDREYNYSLDNVKSVIDIVKPDILLVEVRQETVEKFDTHDGPIEMIFAWCYANERGIPVKGCDWWHVAEEDEMFALNDERDLRIFQNIRDEMSAGKTVLALCGATHRMRLDKQFSDLNYKKIELADIDAYFSQVSKSAFVYPKALINMIEKKIMFMRGDFLKELFAYTKEETKGREEWLNRVRDLCESLQGDIDTYILPNKLCNDD